MIATGRREDHVRCVAGEIEELGHKSVVCTADVTRRESLEHLQAKVAAKFGNIDVLVNCAGKTKRTPTL